MDLIVTKLSINAVKQLLQRADDDFQPPLSKQLNLTAYAEKLSQNADFVLLVDNNRTEGCIAFYTNLNGRFAYVTHYWISVTYRGRGLAIQMLNRLVTFVVNCCNEVRLEVSKTNPARFFYQKVGFQIAEDRGQKWLLFLPLSLNQKGV